ncbi:unnamed protein product [Tilletia laevis]|uniref:Transmembrane protein n=1 Tax=Tilletia laevis TaxID=157183 RepID=A0A9N8QQI5_9BASI|nr:unnamed protein product [Tilletia caries]CAD6901060.1 unnamed protein product [Tilletia controversa]CAD6932531.1 unnamed protein product [Tilletia laevis]CAD6964427.1 unnamed protein product [Tilletia laevis]
MKTAPSHVTWPSVSRTKPGLPIWRSAGAAGSVVNIGHHDAQRSITYFTVQCGCIAFGGTCIVALGVGVVATLYPSMEAQAASYVFNFALVIFCYITLLAAGISLVSIAYSSFEKPFSALLQATAASLDEGQHVVGQPADRSSSPTSAGGHGRKARPLLSLNIGATGPPIDLEDLEGEPDSSCHASFKTTPELPSTAEFNKPSFSVRGPVSADAIFVRSRKNEPMRMDIAAATCHTSLSSSTVSSSYLDPARGIKVSCATVTMRTPATLVGPDSPCDLLLQRSLSAPFSSYYGPSSDPLCSQGTKPK